MNYLNYLESESIEIFRNTAKKGKSVLLTSLGKDSTVLLHIAKKAFWPEKLPFQIMHIDTKWKFKEMYEFRDKLTDDRAIDLIVYSNKEGVDNGINPIDNGSEVHTRIMKTEALLKALNHYKFEVVYGGARRDEEKSRSKERILSLRDSNHTWDPKNQRPELWNIYNNLIPDEYSFRIFPLSNWTEIDIWRYIKREDIEIVDLYFSKKRNVTKINNSLIHVNDERMNYENLENLNVRFRTLGCYPLTACIKSNAKTIEEIINELEYSDYSERAGRLIDQLDSDSMEKKKKEGYF